MVVTLNPIRFIFSWWHHTLLPNSILSCWAWFLLKAKLQSLLVRRKESWENTDGSSLCSWKFPATMTQAGSSVIFLLMVGVWLRSRATLAGDNAKMDPSLIPVPQPSQKLGLGKTMCFRPVLLFCPLWRLTFEPWLREVSFGCTPHANC